MAKGNGHAPAAGDPEAQVVLAVGLGRGFGGKSTGLAELVWRARNGGREVIIAEAYRSAQEVKGEGDAKATAIYAEAFGKDREFYSFYRSLEAYRASFAGKDDVLVVDPSSDFFRFMKDAGGAPRN